MIHALLLPPSNEPTPEHTTGTGKTLIATVRGVLSFILHLFIALMSSSAKRNPNCVLAYGISIERFHFLGYAITDTSLAHGISLEIISIERFHFSRLRHRQTRRSNTTQVLADQLNAHEPLILSGPEVFSQYVGQSGAKIRQLLSPGEWEQKEMPVNCMSSSLMRSMPCVKQILTER